MNGDPFTIRERAPEDDPQIVEIFRANGPDRSPPSVEVYRHNLDSIPAQAGFRAMVAERTGQVIAVAEWNRRLYSAEPDSYHLDLTVHPAHWGHGVGSGLYDLALEDIRGRGARRLVTNVREDRPTAIQFAINRGFEQTGFGNRGLRLDVQSATLERSREAATRVRESGIRIVSLTEFAPDEAMLRALCATDNASAASIPSSEEWVDMPFDEWKRYVLGSPGYDPDAFFVALDGERPVGLSFLELRPRNTATTGYTGVHPEYHRRGIARALKLHVVQWAQERGIKAIFTGNDVNNKPMLAINLELGFQPTVTNVEMAKTI
jgi:GNAT superfamily N-acetyltransferase